MTLEPLLNASPVIQIHAACAIVALVLGALQLFRKKGDAIHRALGKTWVALMAIVALSSFLIWTIRLVWLFSPIHLLSIFTLVMLWLGVSRARRHEIEAHSRIMRLTYVLALIVTGLLTFYPGRIMYKVAFGPEGATPEKLMVFGGVIVVVAIASFAVMRWRKSRDGGAFVLSH